MPDFYFYFLPLLRNNPSVSKCEQSSREDGMIELLNFFPFFFLHYLPYFLEENPETQLGPWNSFPEH